MLSQLRKLAPANAPAAPGRPIRHTIRQSTLPSRQWARPETSWEPTCEKLTVADASAGVVPSASRNVADVTP